MRLRKRKGLERWTLYTGLPEGIDRRHQCRCAAKEIRHLNRFIDLGFSSASGAGSVGDVGHTIGVGRDRIHNHGHQDFILGRDSTVLQDALALRQVRLRELRITLLESLYPRWDGGLSHSISFASMRFGASRLLRSRAWVKPQNLRSCFKNPYASRFSNR